MHGYFDYSYLTLEQAKIQAIAEVDVWYGGAAQDVFDSDALGQLFRYYCWPESVSKFNTMAIANKDGTLMCGQVPRDAAGNIITDQDPVYDQRYHSSRQVNEVQKDYAVFVGRVDAYRESIIAQMHAATTTTELEDIVTNLQGFKLV
jgi:hypothetical protein